jgi:hypothetical protein
LLEWRGGADYRAKPLLSSDNGGVPGLADGIAGRERELDISKMRIRVRGTGGVLMNRKSCCGTVYKVLIRFGPSLSGPAVNVDE